MGGRPRAAKAIVMPCVYAVVVNAIRFACSCNNNTVRRLSATAATDDVHFFVLMMVFSFAFTNIFTSGLKVTAGR